MKTNHQRNFVASNHVNGLVLKKKRFRKISNKSMRRKTKIVIQKIDQKKIDIDEAVFPTVDSAFNPRAIF
jgi:hypothetical protein